MVSLTMSESSPSKMVHITIPGSGSGFSSPRTESISAKMKKILTSPKGNRGKGEPTPNKTFGVLLDYLFERDKCDVPVIVTRLCEYLKKNGMRQEGLFRVNGNIKVVERLKASFDKNGDADLEEIGDVPACASLLKMFLRELTDPVIPDDLQPLFINIQHKYCQDKANLIPRVKQLVQRMPKLNLNLLKYLCEFMLYITNSSDGNKMTPLALAIVFGPNIFRCGEGLNGLRDQAYVNAVLLLMLQEFQEVFGNEELEKESRDSPERPLSYLEHVKRKQEKNNEQKPTAEPAQLHLDNAGNKIIQKPSSSDKNEANQLKNGRKERPTSQVLVENTINIAVKELLFGPGMVTSSCESERQDDSKNDESVENIYRSVKDQVKNFPFDMTEETLNEGLICQTRRTRSCGAKKERRNVYERCMSSPGKEKKEITDEDLEFVGGVSGETLRRLTSTRVHPPRNRRKPSFNRNKKEIQNHKVGDSCDNKLKDSLLNNVNKEFVYTQYDNENNLNAKNIDNKFSNAVQYNSQENESKQNVNHDRGWDAMSTPSKSKHSQQSSTTSLHRLSDASPSTSLNNANPSTDVTRLHDYDEKSPLSPLEKYTGSPLSPPEKCTGQDALPLFNMSPPTLKKRIISLKKIISNLEANFEETNGRKAKPSEKAHIQKYIAELGRAKKQLKEVLADHKDRSISAPDTTPVLHQNSSNASSSVADAHRGDLKSKEETLNLLLRKLQDKRIEAERPEEILAMTGSELKDEKLAVQKALLMYENQHGRPSTKEDKTLMRPLYDRYRKIKRLIATGKPEPSSKQNNSEQQVSPQQNERLHTINLSREESVEEAQQNEINTRVSNIPHCAHSNPYDSHSRNAHSDSENLCDTFLVTNRLHETLDMSPGGYDSPRTGDDAILHDATINELLEQQRLTKRTKKRLGKLLKDFEEDFYNQFNRKVQKNDRLPKQAEYREYKLIKAKLRLVEALIEKKKGSTHAE